MSLVSAEAGPDRITLRWYCADAGLSASVERRSAAGGWAVIGAVAPDGSGMLLFEDRDVVPGGTSGRVVLAYTLATREPARVELLDVAGRRLFARDLTGLEPGDHTLAIDDHVRLPAGIYLVRLSQGGGRAAGKTAIVH